MPAASHHYAHPDSRPVGSRLGAGRHGAGGPRAPPADARPAPRAAPIASCAGCAPRPVGPPSGSGSGHQGLQLVRHSSCSQKDCVQVFVFTNDTFCCAFNMLYSQSSNRCISPAPAFIELYLCTSYSFFFDLHTVNSFSV